MKKFFLVLVVLLSVTSFAVASGSSDETTEVAVMDMEAMQEFTVESLAEYDGKDGRPGYIAYDGMVYDVSNHPRWKTGTHNGQMAGTDITDAIKKAPHGASKIESLTAVGKLVK